MPIPKESALTPDEIVAIHETPSDHLSMLTSQREVMRCMEAGGVHTIGHGCTPALCTRWLGPR